MIVTNSACFLVMQVSHLSSATNALTADDDSPES